MPRANITAKRVHACRDTATIPCVVGATVALLVVVMGRVVVAYTRRHGKYMIRDRAAALRVMGAGTLNPASRETDRTALLASRMPTVPADSSPPLRKK